MNTEGVNTEILTRLLFRLYGFTSKFRYRTDELRERIDLSYDGATHTLLIKTLPQEQLLYRRRISNDDVYEHAKDNLQSSRFLPYVTITKIPSVVQRRCDQDQELSLIVHSIVQYNQKYKSSSICLLDGPTYCETSTEIIDVEVRVNLTDLITNEHQSDLLGTFLEIFKVYCT